MSLYVDPPFALGQTLGVSSATDGTGWVGAVKVFPDVDPKTGKVRSNRLKTCIAVRNSSGVALAPKRAVAFTAGSYSAVSGYTRLTNDAVAGVVDEFLPTAGVAANDVFWVTVAGPTELLVSQTDNQLGPKSHCSPQIWTTLATMLTLLVVPDTTRPSRPTCGATVTLTVAP